MAIAKRRKVAYSLAGGLAVLAFLVPVEAEHDPQACDGPTNVRAMVENEGILITWDEWRPARSYEVSRAKGNGEFVQIGVKPGDNPNDGEIDPHHTSLFDFDVESGSSYRYQVRGLGPPPHVSEVCSTVTATAVPVAPTLAAGVAATALGMATYALLCRKGD